MTSKSRNKRKKEKARKTKGSNNNKPAAPIPKPKRIAKFTQPKVKPDVSEPLAEPVVDHESVQADRQLAKLIKDITLYLVELNNANPDSAVLAQATQATTLLFGQAMMAADITVSRAVQLSETHSKNYAELARFYAVQRDQLTRDYAAIFGISTMAADQLMKDGLTGPVVWSNPNEKVQDQGVGANQGQDPQEG